MRLNGDLKHTCALDFADLDEGDDDHAARLLGIKKTVFSQRVAEAAFKMREGIRDDERAEDIFSGIIKHGEK